MTRFAATTLDMSMLPPAAALDPLDYEQLLTEATAAFKARWDAARVKRPNLPDFDTLMLEGEPVRILLETHAYLLMLTRQRINEAVLACMVATAGGADLDNLALFYGVVRAEGETDAQLRERVVLAPEGFATAGPVGAYQFHARSADPVAIKDIAVLVPSPGTAQIVVQASAGDGTPSAALIAKVLAALNSEEIIPHTDMVNVVPVVVRPYAIDAGLILRPGPDGEIVRQRAIAAVTAYAAKVSRIGQDVTASGLYGALQQPEVQRVVLRSPADGLVIADSEASFCTGITVTVDGRDD